MADHPPDTRLAVFAPIRSRNVVEETLERIAHALKAGTYVPGERLPSERELARLLAVSRQTVSEATRALAQAGRLELRRGRNGGAYVLAVASPRRAPNPKKVAEAMGASLQDALDLRWAVERATAELAAQRRTSADINDLNDLHVTCVSAQLRAYRPADMLLHLKIAEIAGSISLADAVRDVQMRLTDMFQATPVIDDVLRNSDRQHDAIISAIVASDPAAARAAMEEHLEGSHAFLKAFLDAA